ncbi:MAG: hypothetical protein H0X66_00275 [Verrucomicrobia bacterium]|nr:hypothetical protein [Verrucomicrobiota bacterium]
MSKKNIFLVLVLVALGALYIVYFTDLFEKPVISISARPRVARASSGNQYSVSFSFDRRCELTEIKVVSVSELETNKYARAYWHMISDTNSAPVKGILYGENLKGMKPKIPKMKPEPLAPGQKYRLMIEAGKNKGQVDFDIPARQAAR